MALLKSVTNEHGQTTNNAYHKVSKIQVGPKDKMMYEMSSFVSADSTAPLSKLTFVCDCDPDGGNIMGQAYTDLKGRDYMAGAVDA